ncbi:MAG: amidohydrolase family protein [Pseudomonadota bacterium]
MSYAHRETIFDADTHMMERPEWVAEFADPGIRPKLSTFLQGSVHGMKTVEDALEKFTARAQNPALREEANRSFMSMEYKGWHGLGAFDAMERKHANDLLGFKASIVFPTEAFNQVIAARDHEVLIGGVRALNRGMVSFCGVDSRMFGVFYVPLGLGPQIACSILDDIIAAGGRTILIDTIAGEGDNSFTHPNYDVVWSKIVDADISVTLHIGAQGGAYRSVPDSFFNNGRVTRTHGSGDVPPNAMGYMGMHFAPSLFLAAMIFDGVLERFPTLRIAVVELGASWIISWMKHLDQAFRAFRRLQDLSEVKLLPSEYVQRQIKVTPFAGEDIGWLLKSGAADLLMFASDYPHHEGTDDPIGRFERTMDGIDEPLRKKFYEDNFRTFLGAAGASL